MWWCGSMSRYGVCIGVYLARCLTMDVEEDAKAVECISFMMNIICNSVSLVNRRTGHVMRLEESDPTKNVFCIKPKGNWDRRRGRPKLRWCNELEEDIKWIGCRNWRINAQSRGEWWKLLEEVKPPPRDVVPMEEEEEVVVLVVVVVVVVVWYCAWQYPSRTDRISVVSIYCHCPHNHYRHHHQAFGVWCHVLW